MRYAQAARRYIMGTAATGVLITLLVIGQAYLISRIISPIITGEKSASEVSPLIWILLGVVVLRGLTLLFQESRAHRAATHTIIELRRRVIEHAATLGPRWQGAHGPEVTTLLTRGLDDLEPYFTRYLPQLVLAATVTPMAALVMLLQDIPSTIIVAFTIPLIPIFMILIGKMTQKHSEERLEAMERLGAQVLDLIAGLPTLKALGREIGPGRRVRELGRAYNESTMRTLRVAFLSGAVLEFLTTLSVALIAVEVGFRLLFGHMDLATGLFVIMIAPEVYQPMRQVGFQFHASANGVAAADAVFEVLEAPAVEDGDQDAPSLVGARIELQDVSVQARGVNAPDHLSAAIPAGTLTALVGPSGAGKTTSSYLLLGLLTPDSGRVLIYPAVATSSAAISSDARGDVLRAGSSHAIDLASIRRESWWKQISWVPQRPILLPGTLLSNVLPTSVRSSRNTEELALAELPTEMTERLSAAAVLTGFDEVLATRDQGWDAPIGHGGVGLSLGQRQRLALTRALLDDAPLVIMDEPTAHLDAAAEARVLDGVKALRESGKTVIVIAHRPSLTALADHVISLEPSQAAATGTEAPSSPISQEARS